MATYYLNRRNIIFIQKYINYIGIVGLLALLIGLYHALYNSPPDYQQEDNIRIMYIHVPCSWITILIYIIMAINSILAFMYRWFLGYIVTKVISEIGLIFSATSIITGCIWGKAVWGISWVWDARLTSSLILFFVYLGYHFLTNSFSSRDKGLQAGGILIIIGLINIPIIKFSVTWWHTLHQKSSFSSIFPSISSSIHNKFLIPLLIMFFSILIISFWLFFVRLETELLERKIKRIISQEEENICE